MDKVILVADDDRSLVRMMEVNLTRATRAYRVLTAYDGDAALQVLREKKPDLAVIDAVMPGKDGIQVIMAARVDAAIAKIPIICLVPRATDTPLVMEAAHMACIGGGHNDVAGDDEGVSGVGATSDVDPRVFCLSKPFSPITLITFVMQMLDKYEHEDTPYSLDM